MTPASMLLFAAVLAVAVAVAHSWLGERYIIRRLLRRSDLPRLFGDDSFTRATIRYAWHLTTVAWFGLAGVLVVLSGSTQRLTPTLLFVVAGAFFASALLAIVSTRARHLSWIVFVIIGTLCLAAIR